jgi:hypothetical protein
MTKKKKLKRPTAIEKETMKQNHLARPEGVPSEEEKFKAVVREILDEGYYPGPTLVNTRRGAKPGKRGLRNFSGRESQWRAEVFQEKGWVYIGDPNGTMRGSQPTWVSPEEYNRIRAQRAAAQRKAAAARQAGRRKRTGRTAGRAG